jgi:hypothetical protein
VSVSIEQKERTEIRIIVAFEDEYHAYQETLAATIRILRSDAEVVTTEPRKLGALAKHFAPDIVIGSRCNDTELEGVPAWIELSLDPAQATKIYMDGKHSEMVNPTLDKLLSIIEEASQITGARER